MALTAHALVSYATVRDALGLEGAEKQDVIERLINMASDAIEAFCGRHFEYSASITDLVLGHGDPYLFVPRPPLLSIASIKLLNIDGTTSVTYDTVSYAIDNALSGLIYRSNLWPVTSIVDSGATLIAVANATERRALQVIYAGGWVTQPQVDANSALTRTLPYDVEEAALQTVVGHYHSMGRDPFISSKSTQNVSTSWRDAGERTGEHVLTPAVRGMLAPYRMAVL